MMTRASRSIGAVVAALAVAGCRPELNDRPWLISDLQIVGVKIEPPEVMPGTEVAAQVIAVGPGGEPDTSGTRWSICQTPKPLGENRAVTPDCLAPASADAIGSAVHLTLSSDACQSFGPDAPQPAPGAPPTRPHDPDATGGYYQPIAISLDDSVSAALERIRCGLPDASLDVARAFQTAYQPNQNPTITGLTVTSDGAAVDPSAIAAGARLSLEVTWSPTSTETFPVFDRAAQTLTPTTEVLTASWYVTAGVLDRAAAEVRDQSVVSAGAIWIAPATPAAVEALVVLRDSRGGADFARASLSVR